MKMRRKIRVYLDTSVISALFDERNPERKSLTEAFFAEIGNFEIFEAVQQEKEGQIGFQIQKEAIF